MILGVAVGVPFTKGKKVAQTFVSDTFNRADSLSLGNADTGQAWEISGTGNIGISSNQAYTDSDSDKFAVIQSNAADGKISIKMVVAHQYSKMLWRFTDTNNHFWIEGGLTLYLRKKVNGSVTTLATKSHTVANGDVFLVEVNGTNHKFYINGQLIFEFTDSSFTTVTKHGFGVYSTTARFDDFKVEAI